MHILKTTTDDHFEMFKVISTWHGGGGQFTTKTIQCEQSRVHNVSCHWSLTENSHCEHSSFNMQEVGRWGSCKEIGLDDIQKLAYIQL